MNELDLSDPAGNTAQLTDVQMSEEGAEPAAQTLQDFLQKESQKGILRFLTCGSVDDGKSTLIGRLLYDTQLIFEDQLDALERDSAKMGTTGGELDLALLVDGLQSEREQGITIDVAYRYFATPKRKFIVADTPGHEQYTRNMATGASTCEHAVILVDAAKGVQTQTRRHSFIVSLLGIRNVAVAVNKMDLIGFSQDRFNEIAADYRKFAEKLDFEQITIIPISALNGDNVIAKSKEMTWYDGPSLLEHLETTTVGHKDNKKNARFPVQWVNRPNSSFRGYSGTLASGEIKPGDKVVVLPSAKPAQIEKLVTADGDLQTAKAGDAFTLTLDREIDIVRGDVIAAEEGRPESSDQIAAHIIWMNDTPLLPGRPYLLKCGAKTVTASISDLKHKINIQTLEPAAAKTLALNEIGFCNLSLSRPIVFDPYKENRETGSFILIDKLSNATVGAGLISYGLRRATNIHWQALEINKKERAGLKGQKPVCLWFTGLSGSGKSTIATLLEKKLHTSGRHTYVLDGDNVRHGLNRDLGFTDADRVENIRRVAETAKLMVDAGLIVVVSFISPFRSERRMARDMFEEGEFLEIFVDTPLEVCEQRDPKGLYKKARAGEIQNFTGISSTYEAPELAEVILPGGDEKPEDLVNRLIETLEKFEVV